MAHKRSKRKKWTIPNLSKDLKLLRTGKITRFTPTQTYVQVRGMG
jgi:hypothetical protein